MDNVVGMFFLFFFNYSLVHYKIIKRSVCFKYVTKGKNEIKGSTLAFILDVLIDFESSSLLGKCFIPNVGFVGLNSDLVRLNMSIEHRIEKKN